ncbi:MAG: flagellar brake protein [Gammaproteobacteria bacterium]|nr:flagellar brake protein [Gammaproteobacteria bacterium]
MTGIIRFESPAELERFKVESRNSIVTIFQQLERKGVPVHLQTAEGKAGESQVLHIDSKNNTLLLAYTKSHDLNSKILENGAYFYADHFSAQVQFYIPKLAKVMFQDGYAFTVSIPNELYRIQRRENFRARVPERNGVSCAIPNNGAGFYQVPIADISRGGVALLDEKNTLSLEQGKVLRNCQLQLPTVGAVNADMQVRNRYHYYSDELHQEVSRIGCQFAAISSGMENLLQRYIDQLEMRRRSSM